MRVGGAPLVRAAQDFGLRARTACASSRVSETTCRNPDPIVLNAVIGPRGDAYRPEAKIAIDAADEYFAEQLGWLAGTEADMVTALTFNQPAKPPAWCGPRALRTAGRRLVHRRDQRRSPDGQDLAEPITRVDQATDGCTAYFMINCAHPEHLAPAWDAPWARQVRGIRANASRRSHAELNELRNSIPEIRTNSRASIAS